MWHTIEEWEDAGRKIEPVHLPKEAHLGPWSFLCVALPGTSILLTSKTTGKIEEVEVPLGCFADMDDLQRFELLHKQPGQLIFLCFLCFRICQDLRELNSNTFPAAYAMPELNHHCATPWTYMLSGRRMYCSFDARSFFNQFKIHEDDQVEKGWSGCR
jgi:hypothetical protein